MTTTEPPAAEECEAPDCQRPIRRRPYCSMHETRLYRYGSLDLPYEKTTAGRFWARVEVRGPDDCWPWAGRVDSGNYGLSAVLQGTTGPAHRSAYMLTVGPIPNGAELDHLCHTRDAACAGGNTCLHRLCVNPSHLEPVTPQQNSARRPVPSACPQGHDFTPENTGRRNNKRFCRKCKNARRTEMKRRRRAAVIRNDVL